MSAAYILYSDFEIYIPYSQSLKQKRQVVQRLKDRLRNQFNVSVAEVSSLEDWQRAGMALVMVGSSRKQLDSQQNALEAFILEVVDAEVVWLSREWV